MRSIREDITAVLDRLHADLDELTELDVAELTTLESFAVLEPLGAAAPPTAGA